MKKEEIRALFIKAKFYRFAAFIFAICGIAVFGFMYYYTTDGNARAVLENPYLILILLFPFLPASILSWQAVRNEKKLMALLESQKDEF